MYKLCALVIVCVCSAICVAQGNRDDTQQLIQLRSKYDDPFERGLKSFDCAVDFSWKQHWSETYRVGDEGTNEEIETRIQPLHNRVTLTRDDAIVSSGLTDAEEQQLPRGGMAEGLLKHAVRFSLRTWLVASNNQLIPPPNSPVQFEKTASGYGLNFKIQSVDVTMMFNQNMGLQSMAEAKDSSDRQEFTFEPGPEGFLLHSWTMGEDGAFKLGNHLIFTYTYQTVGQFQIPSQLMVNRESHHEIWRFALTGCKISMN